MCLKRPRRYATRLHTHDFLQIGCVALVIALRRSKPSISGWCVSPRRCQLTSTECAGNRPDTQPAIPFPNPGRVFVWRVWRVRVRPISRVARVSDLITSEPVQERVLFYVVQFPLMATLQLGGRTLIFDTFSRVN